MGTKKVKLRLELGHFPFGEGHCKEAGAREAAVVEAVLGEREFNVVLNVEEV